jgi:hypothetical protein
MLEVTPGETEKIEPPKKNAAAQALSKLGASKGGKTRAENLSAKKRSAIAKKRHGRGGKNRLSLMPFPERKQHALLNLWRSS